MRHSRQALTPAPRSSTRLSQIILLSIAALLIAAPSASAIGIDSFDGSALLPDGSPDTQAGSHPAASSVTFRLPTAFNAAGQNLPTEDLKDATVDLPPGLIGNPQAVPACTYEQFADTPPGAFRNACPLGSQIGVVTIWTVGLSSPFAVPFYSRLYNLQPPPGVPALLGFAYAGVPAFISAKLRTGGDYGVTTTARNIQESLALAGVTVEVWGVPADPSHDPLRGACIESGGHIEPISGGCPSPEAADPKAFITLPTSCTGPLSTGLSVSGWQGGQASASFLSHDNGEPPLPIGNTGCAALDFSPTLEARPTTNVADSPSGLKVDLHIPQPSGQSSGIGNSHHCTTGKWSNAPTGFSFRWLRNGVPIAGAETDTYAAQEADVGALLQCEVSATNAGVGAGLAVSEPFAVHPVAPGAPPVAATPTISGQITNAGGTLSCDPGKWQGNPSFAFQWFKDGSPLAAETQSSYLLAPNQTPLTLQCEVLGTNAVGTVAAFSANSASSPILPSFIVPPRALLPESELPLATAHLRDTTVTLPEGLVINPSGANGLGASSSSQIDLHGEGPAQCPDDSKLGTVEVDTPLLDHPVSGAVYLATPHDNPFGSLLAIYIAIDDPQSGTVVKLAGHVVSDPLTGRLSATFNDNPQLPFEDFKLDFFAGPTAALKTPATCGTYQTTSSLTPWSAPDSGPPATPSDPWQISQGPGGNCSTSEAQLPNTPSFDAGTETPIAGHYSPFVLNLRREDGSQRFSAIGLEPPQGLLAKLAGTTRCSDAALAQAANKSGQQEKASPSCPASSHVGSVVAGAGAGPAPYYAQADAYLAGPYKGAPLSLAIIAPATAGPFDLGTIVTRTALYINPETAQINAISDPIPSILQGIPLDIRTVQVKLDRPGFTLNPTSCDPSEVKGKEISTLGQIASLKSRFQLAECTRLGFKPKMTLSLRGGGTKRGGHPALTVVLKPRPGDANIGSVSVALPHSEFLDQAHIGTVCTRVQWAADACPAGSVYGTVSVQTPLLDQPLTGNVYLRSSDNLLPDLVPDLRGPADLPIRFSAAGRTDSIHGGIRNTFDFVPDAPFTKLVVKLKGGSKGLLENSRDICARPYRATIKFGAHDGAALTDDPELRVKCKHAKKRHRKHRHGKRGRAQLRRQ